jgi:hypothetical protein
LTRFRRYFNQYILGLAQVAGRIGAAFARIEEGAYRIAA